MSSNKPTTGKINLKEAPPEELWQWLQNKVANKYCGASHEELSEREKRMAFIMFVHVLKAHMEKDQPHQSD